MEGGLILYMSERALEIGGQGGFGKDGDASRMGSAQWHQEEVAMIL